MNPRKLPESKGKVDTLGGVSLRLPGVGIPRRMFATVRMSQQGYLGVGAASTGLANVYSNAFYQPFNSGIPITSGWALNFTDGSSTTAQFVPSSFFTAGYANYRVHSAILKITAVTGTGSDSMNVWMYPTSANATTAVNLRESAGQPGFKSMMITSGMRPTTIMSRIRCSDVWGQSAAQYSGSASTFAALTSIPSELTEWQVFYATMDGAVTTGQNYFTLSVELEVEFFDPIDSST